MFGVAQPTLDGVMDIINMATKVCSFHVNLFFLELVVHQGAGITGQRVMWVNLRLEPVVFINRRPYYVTKPDGSPVGPRLDPIDYMAEVLGFRSARV